MSTIIQVENLSKKYLIGHQQLRGKKTFREELSQGLQKFAGKFIHPFSKNISSSSPYEEFWALKDINFEVEQGSRVGIIGRNGAGKSTLLKILSRITEPSSGKITIKGRIASLLEVGTGFNNELTGRENIYLNGAILGMYRSEIKKKFDEIVDFAGVEKFLDTPVKRYSSGMYVRLAFAIAAHLEPDILVIDEVLAVGDSEFQDKCLGKMQEISKNSGRTVLFVSHNMAAIKSLCDKAILLEKGRIRMFESTTNTINEYRSLKIKNQGLSTVSLSKENKVAYFKNIRMFSGEKITNNFLWEEEKILEMEFFVNEPLSETYIAAEVYNWDNIPVLWMSDIKNIEYKKRSPGNYIIRFQIPPKLLPEGVYSINIGIIKLNSNPIHALYDVYEFHIVDTSSILATKSIKYPATVSVEITAKYKYPS